MTVITVTNAPPSLRGDLTKWMQEISVGVYIGNFNIKIREELWERVKQNIGKGQATLSYGHRNELGYRFETYQTDRQAINFDGIQLVLFPTNAMENSSWEVRGFSDASKRNKSKKFSRGSSNYIEEKCYIVLDIETDGLDSNKNHIIEIGAIKVNEGNIETIDMLIDTQKEVPEKIVNLTGITEKMLANDGVPIGVALDMLVEFVENLPIIGYSIDFDLSFINSELFRLEKPQILNKRYDLLRFIKNKNMFLNNYKLSSALDEYGINKKVMHRALSDAQLIYELSAKVNGFLDFVNS